MKKQLVLTALVLALAGSTGFCITNAVQISAGGPFKTALLPDGSVRAWGYSGSGQCGNGGTTNNYSPVSVLTNGTQVLLTNVHTLAAGSGSTLALMSNTTVCVWGNWQFNQLGEGSVTARTKAVPLTGLTNITAISAGDAYGLVISNTYVYGWGQNDYWQTGQTNNNSNIATPTLLSGLSNVIAVSAGNFHSLAITSNHLAYGWGTGGLGQMGDGQNITTNGVTQVLLSNVTAVAAGYWHSLAIADGYAYAWGRNQYGYLGVSPFVSQTNVPTLVADVAAYPAFTNIVAVTNTSSEVVNVVVISVAPFTNAPTTSNTTNTTTISTCVTPSYVTNTIPFTNTCIDITYTTNVVYQGIQGHVVQIAAGFEHSLALTDDGRVWAWGRNVNGSLGNGNTTEQDTPVAVLNMDGTGPLMNVASISLEVSLHDSMALLKNGTVLTWGSNAYGQLGNGSTNAYSALPVITNN